MGPGQSAVKNFMKKIVCSLALFLTLTFVATGVPLRALQQQPQQQPGPGKKFVFTPFGPIEVDISDPRPAIAVGPPVPQPATPPAQQPAVPPAPPAAAVTPAQQDDQVSPISLRFDNQDIYQVIRIIAEALRINYVIDPAVRGNANISTYGDLRRSDLLPILEAILKINGATMVKVGNLYQIVPANTAVRMPL